MKDIKIEKKISESDNDQVMEKKYVLILDDVFMKCIAKELDRLEIDISNDDYHLKGNFKYLDKEYVWDKIYISKSWWIEKNLVGQERLKKIYGIYALGIEHNYSEPELKRSAWMGNLADKYAEAKIRSEDFIRTEKDVEQYFYRKYSNTEDSVQELGLVERLKRLGFDIDKFNGPKAGVERIKLLYFLFEFEFKKKIKLYPFLSNPSFENIDNNIVRDKNRNGELMAYLKNNIMKEIDIDYIAELEKTLGLVIDRWEEQIFFVKNYASITNDIMFLEDSYSDLEWVYNRMEDAPVIYIDSLMETFYLKLSLHEMMGRERELIEISEKTFVEAAEPNEFQRARFRKYVKEMIRVKWIGADKYDTVMEYIKNNRKALAQCVFGKKSISGNDYRQFDQAGESITAFLDFYMENTKAIYSEYVPVILLIGHIQEYIFGNEKVIPQFYRHESKDKVTLRTELKNGKEAKRRSQYEWIEKVNRRYYVNRGINIRESKVGEVIKYLDKLLGKVYTCNSLWEVKYTAWLILLYIEAFVGNRYESDNRYNALQIFLECEQYHLKCSDKKIIYLFMTQLERLQFEDLMEDMKKNMINSKEDHSCTYRCDVKPDCLYAGKKIEAFLDINVSIINKEIEIVNGGIREKEVSQ